MTCICGTEMVVQRRHTDQTPDMLTLPGIAWCPACLRWFHITTADTPKPGVDNDQGATGEAT